MKPTLRILLQLDRDGDSVAGTLVEPDGTSRPFHGYMNLISALEAARTAGDRDRSPGGSPGVTSEEEAESPQL